MADVENPETQETKNPEDPKTQGHKDPKTHGPIDPRTSLPKDPKTQGPEGHKRIQVHKGRKGHEDPATERCKRPNDLRTQYTYPRIPKPNPVRPTMAATIQLHMPSD